MKKHPVRKYPRDHNQRAKAIVDIVTGETEPQVVTHVKNAAAVALGRLGGLKGGPARARKLSHARLSDIARAAAQARWEKE